MWNRKSGFVDDLPLEEDYVEVESTRAPTLRAHASGVGLDPLQLDEEVVRRELGLYGDHLIEEWSLGYRSDRSGLFSVGLTQHPRSSQGRDRASRLSQKYLTLAEVGAKRYVGDISHARSRSAATSA